MSNNWIYSWQWKSSRIRQQFYRQDYFAMNTDTRMSGSTVKNHISLKTVFGYNVIRSTSSRSWFLVYQRVLPQACLLQHPWHLQGRKLIILNLPQARLPHRPWHLQPCQAKVWLDKNGRDPCSSEISEEQLLTKPTKNPKPNKNVDHDQERWDPCHSEIPEWLQEFRENLVDDRIPEHRDSHASSSHEPSLEPGRSEALGKHSVYTHFPKDRNCKICQRTKITRATCRRRIGGVVPRAENFGDLISTDHSESRNNHRYAVVEQDSATQWIQSYLCKTKLLMKNKGARKSSWSRTGSLNSFTQNSYLSWNHFTSTPHRSETNGIAERGVRRVKEGTSAVLLQSGLDENWWADSMECYTYLRNTQDLLSDGKTPYERRFGEI